MNLAGFFHISQRGLTAATKLEDWVDYAIRSDCAPYSLAQFDNLAQKTRLSRLVVQRAAAVMLRQGSGHIVNITSLVDQPLAVVPAAMAALTKGGLAAVTRCLAIDFANRGVRVNAVSPGIINTPMHPAENREFLAGLHPIHRRGEIREVVEAVLYLESAAFVTGEVLHVDGGQHAGRW